MRRAGLHVASLEPSNPKNPKVFFDVTIGDKSAGRIVVEVSENVALSARRSAATDVGVL